MRFSIFFPGVASMPHFYVFSGDDATDFVTLAELDDLLCECYFLGVVNHLPSFTEWTMDAIKKSLDEALDGLKKILADPKVKVDDAIKASELLKSLKRFRDRL